jgi:hypothetical protein
LKGIKGNLVMIRARQRPAVSPARVQVGMDIYQQQNNGDIIIGQDI